MPSRSVCVLGVEKCKSSEAKTLQTSTTADTTYSKKRPQGMHLVHKKLFPQGIHVALYAEGFIQEFQPAISFRHINWASAPTARKLK
jgi:hypothetical protein